MRLRTTGLVAGALGLVVLAIGLVADANRLEPRVTATVAVETSIVVVGPEVLELAPGGRVTAVGNEALSAHSARPVDVKAWLGDHAVTYVTGMVDWDELSVRKADRVVATPDDSASPAPTASPTPSPSPTEDDSEQGADDEATEDDVATPNGVQELMLASSDHWRQTWNGQGRVSVATAAVPAGQPLVLVATSGEPLQEVTMVIDRDINDGWISPLIWWGILLVAVGLVALIFVVIDLRPVQAQIETWIAHRRRIGSGDHEPKPGSRRARRTSSQGVPVVPLTEDNAAPHENPEEGENRS